MEKVREIKEFKCYTQLITYTVWSESFRTDFFPHTFFFIQNKLHWHI